MIATDVASRGLDFPSVSYVFNFEMPTNIEDYVHRIGRTGRVGNTGVAISFINEGNKPIIKDLYSLMSKLNQEIPDWFESMYVNVKDYRPCMIKYLLYLASSYYNQNGSNNHNKYGGSKDYKKSERGENKGYPNKKEKSPFKNSNKHEKYEKNEDECSLKKPVFFNNTKDENVNVEMKKYDNSNGNESNNNNNKQYGGFNNKFSNNK